MNIDDVKEFTIFENLSLNEVSDIVVLGKELTFTTDITIIEEAEQDSTPDIYIILKGRVQVQIDPRYKVQVLKADQRQLAILNKGDIFGERGMLKGTYRSASVTAYGDVTVLKINCEKLLSLLTEKPGLGFVFMKNLATILSDRIVDLIYMWRNDL